MKAQKIKELIPLALLVIALLYTTIVVMTTERSLMFSHWVGYGLTAIVLVTYFLSPTFFKIMLTVTVVLGLINVAAFTPVVWTAGGSLTAFDAKISIGLQLYSLLVFVTLVYAYRKLYSAWAKQFLAWINKDGL